MSICWLGNQICRGTELLRQNQKETGGKVLWSTLQKIKSLLTISRNFWIPTATGRRATMSPSGILDRHGPLTVGYGANKDKMGPELGFGIEVGNATEAPVLLVKCSWGGKSLAIDFRPPSAGKPTFELNPRLAKTLEETPETLGFYYRKTIEHYKDVMAKKDNLFPQYKGKTYVLKGIAWHQGWNDRVNAPFVAEYERNLPYLIKDLRKDLGAPNAPFVIAETGMTGLTEKHPRALALMEAQKAVCDLPEFKKSTAFVTTKKYWVDKTESPSGQGYHWNTNAGTYYHIGQAMGKAMLKLNK